MSFGLWDTADKCWLGNADGPMRYEENLTARAAATIATEQLGRLIRPMPIPTDPFRYKDEISTRFTSEEAIKRIESRSKRTV